MPPPTLLRPPYCELSSRFFVPDEFLERWSRGEIETPKDNDLQGAITKAFNIGLPDVYTYHATLSETLDEAQNGIKQGAGAYLHAWYRNEDGTVVFTSPPAADITAYTSIFSSTTSTNKALTAFASNAKRGSIRSSVAEHLIKHRLFPPSINIPKLKPGKAHINPYLDFWAWSCLNVEWCGPDESTNNVRQSHYILPVFYHHFGCLCPTFEALETIKVVAKNRSVLDLGSGNGYWTYMLRRHGVTTLAVDTGDSLWRVMWIGDTIKADGADYLSKWQNNAQGGGNGGKDAVLLLVYPQVTTRFTVSVLRAYKGTTIVVGGTQNRNGFTGFKGETIAQWMEKNMPDWERVVQVPLPSFAGKDEALFVFEKKV